MAGLAFGWLLGCVWFLPVHAIDRLLLTSERIEGDGWNVLGLQWSTRLADGAITEMTVEKITLPEPYGEITSARIHCPELVIEAGRFHCPRGRATAKAAWLRSDSFAISFTFRPANRQLAMKLVQLPAFGGHVNLTANNHAGWQFEMDAEQVSVKDLSPWLTAVNASLASWQLAGKLDLKLAASDRKLDFRLKATEVSCSDAEGRIATEGLVLDLSGAFQRNGQRWEGGLEGELPMGQAYIEPIFTDLSPNSIELDSKIQYSEKTGIHVAEANIRQTGVMESRMDGHWQDGNLRALKAKFSHARLAKVYEIYAKPFLLGSSLESLLAAGMAEIDIHWADGSLQAMHTTLKDAVIEDTQGRFAWDAVQGDVYWQKTGQSPNSTLQWAGGAAYKLLFGASQLQANLSGHAIRLLKPLRLPLLEGALVIRELAAQNIAADNMAVQFDGELEPLKLEALTSALGWPAFGGELSGRLPDLDYSQGELTLGGALQAEVFDGEVKVENLRIQDPFGSLPQLFADMRLRNLNLEAVTQAFSFGRIEGRLDGDVKQLQMLNWQPVAFDARLGTPDDDDSRRRISQRAIENISAIGGGGAGAVLSRGFLQFFDDFAYDRIGISCRLSAGVCEMGGLGPSSDGKGYVLVKGRLLPRIDVIGYAGEVDWKTLVEQLKSVTEGEGPVLR